MKAFAVFALCIIAVLPLFAADETPTRAAVDASMPPLSFNLGGQAIEAKAWPVELRTAANPDDVRLSRTTANGRTTWSTVYTYPDGGKATVEAVDTGRSSATVRVRWTGVSVAAVRLPVFGIDRVVWRRGEMFGSRPIASLDDAVTTDGRRIVLQHAASQSGLRVEATSEAGALRATRGRDGAAVVEIAAGGNDQPADRGSFTIRLDAFRGDASLVLERARRPAGPGAGLASDDFRPDLGGLAIDGVSGGAEGWGPWLDGRKRVFKPLLADPREARVRTMFLTDRDGDSFFDFGLGSDLGIWYGRDVWSRGDALSIGLRGSVYSRLELFVESFDLQNIDYRGGLVAGYSRGNHSGELMFYHQSSHLGDEVLDFGKRTRFDYSIEALRFLYAYETGPWRIYGGPEYLVPAADPDELSNNWNFRLGAERGFEWFGRPWYAALDLQMKEENNWRPNVTGQVGFELGDPALDVRRPRLFLEIFDGHSNMGQFYEEREQYYMLGMGYEF